MARLTRLDLPLVVHHVCIRGNNGEPIAREAHDLDEMARLWQNTSLSLRVKVHGYAFLSTSVHALVTPMEEGVLSAFMQAVGRRYVQFFNRKYARTGTLWEGRFRSHVLQADPWLISSLVYLDGLCEAAGLAWSREVGGMASSSASSSDRHDAHTAAVNRYPWSSHAHWVGQRLDPLVAAHESMWHLGNTPFEREVHYADRVGQRLAPAQIQAIESALRSGWPLGDAEFVAHLQKLTSRRLEPRRPGRPRQAD